MRFTRIKSSFSDHRRIPRLGRIRLGLKVAVLGPDGKPKLSQSGAPVERPKETSYFVAPPEVKEVYGNEPTELDIMLPNEDPEKIFPQSLAWFGSTKGLKCTGNMEIAERLNERSGEWEKRSCPCEHYKSETNPKGECTESGTLIFMLPKVSMGGTYEVRTGSYHSVVDINSGLDFIRSLIGRISMVPLKLRRSARETHNDGKKQIHHTLSVILEANVEGVNQLRNDTSRILSHAKLEIEGPSEINPILDPVDVSEVMDDEEQESPPQIDAADLADMDDTQLAKVQEELNRRKAQGVGLARGRALEEPKKPNQTTQDAPAPKLKPTPEPKIEQSWETIVDYIDDRYIDLKTVWKEDHQVTNVRALNDKGRQSLLDYLRSHVPTFPY